ncbi:MAG: amino acid permease [Deltaproteobacteria bacterium]|nr:MAG: amino acid permease [Deltaproteobacteria bacterium]
MAESIQEIFKRKLVPVGFQRTMGLFGATTLGIGALMGAGIYVLIGLAAGHAGPAVWLSYLVCGLLSLLSVLVFAELSRRVPVTGGGYAFAYNALGSFWGFMTGWLLALGSIFACAMYATGFAYYFSPLLPHHIPEPVMKGIALTIIMVLTVLNCRGTKGGERVQKIFTWGNLIVLLILILLAFRKADAAHLKPMFPHGLAGMGGAISIIYVSFFGYQLIANNSEEIMSPEKTVPKAMFLAMLVSLTFYVAVAIVSVMVVPWEGLSQSKAPLVDVALKGIGRLGWLLVALGGVLASAAALNSTLLSQGRQIFAMGKDRFLPGILGRVQEVYRTPTAALWAGGLATIAALIFGDLTFIVKSANFCFLASLLPASFALRSLYRSSDTGARPSRWRYYTPYAAFLANLALLLTLDWVSIAFGLQLMAVGFCIFFFYSRKREIRSRTGMSLVLSEEGKTTIFSGSRILVPVANPQTQPVLFTISEALIGNQGGEVVVLNVVQATEQMDFYSSLSEAEDSVHLLDRSTKLPRLEGVKIRPVVRVSRSLPKGIVHAAEEEGCNLIVMGYAGVESPESIQLMEEVINNTRTNIVLFKLKGEFSPKRIAVSLGSSRNLNLIVKLAGVLADRYAGEITFLNVLPPNYTAEQKAHSGKILVEAIKHHVAKALYRIEVASSEEPLDFLVERSSQFDLLIVGTTKVGLLERAVVGPFSSQIVMRSACSVAVVRVAPTVKKFLKV